MVANGQQGEEGANSLKGWEASFGGDGNALMVKVAHNCRKKERERERRDGRKEGGEEGGGRARGTWSRRREEPGPPHHKVARPP